MLIDWNRHNGQSHWSAASSKKFAQFFVLNWAEVRELDNCEKSKTTPMGFEPTRAEHIGLAVQRLNHSATVSSVGYRRLEHLYN